MKQEDLKLLLQDLSARLPYGVKCHLNTNRKIPPLTLVKISKTGGCSLAASDITVITHDRTIEEIKPYLRPMSSMTDEEQKEFVRFETEGADNIWIGGSGSLVDWLNSHHFDWRGLIEKGLTLEAPSDMYKFE